MASVFNSFFLFWGVIIIDYFEKGKTINGHYYASEYSDTAIGSTLLNTYACKNQINFFLKAFSSVQASSVWLIVLSLLIM